MFKKIINSFSVPVLEAKFENVEDLNMRLSSTITQMFENMDDKRLLSYEWDNFILTDNNSPSTGYSSFNHGNLVEDSRFTEVFDLISPIISDFLKQLNYPAARPYEDNWSFENAWANVYPEGAWVPAHNHTPCQWSGVYYVKAATNCGNISFTDPKEYALSNEPEFTRFRGNHKMVMDVEDGKLFMFPGYLKHETQPNHSGEDRIIISFNIKA